MKLPCGVRGLSLVAIVALLGLTMARVAVLERGELDYEGEWASLAQRLSREGATRISARLASVSLERGEHAVFEVCVRGGMDPRVWRDGLDFVVWDPARGVAELKVSLDDEHLARVRRSTGGACLALGGGTLVHSGQYAIDAVFHGKRPKKALAETPLRARVLARTKLTRRDGALVLGVAIAALAVVFSWFTSRQSYARTRGSFAWAFAGFACALALGGAVLSVPLGGATGGLARGLSLAVVELGVAVAFALRLGPVRSQLALFAPVRAPAAMLLLSVGSASLLNPAARLAMRVIPSTGEAPIETFIAWPSGALAFATLGMIVPLAEEVFFRGFIYGALEPRGRTLAFVVTMVSFAAVHVHQSWGNWGALLAVGVTGVVLTTLRMATGSTLVPAVAHVLYNYSLWLNAFA